MSDKNAAGQDVPSIDWLEVDILSVDFETNEMVLILPKEVVARGFHAGKVKVDLSGVQRTSNDKVNRERSE